jgi:uncharacterized YigZ family protein
MEKDTYITIAASSTGIFKDKGSKFLSFAFPVNDEEQVKEHIRQLKKEYFDARHHCYAYRIGLCGEQWRANDDGEPSSTGGKPILGQLLSRELTNVLVVVVRYFGGILLGVSGLINAYRAAAADALDKATAVEKTATEICSFTFRYNDMNTVMKWLKEEQIEILAQQFDMECALKAAVPLAKVDKLHRLLDKIIMNDEL